MSDVSGFADSGGTLEFFIEDNKLNFEINMETVKQTRLQVSSKLLRLARIVGRKEN